MRICWSRREISRRFSRIVWLRGGAELLDLPLPFPAWSSRWEFGGLDVCCALGEVFMFIDVVTVRPPPLFFHSVEMENFASPGKKTLSCSITRGWTIMSRGEFFRVTFTH